MAWDWRAILNTLLAIYRSYCICGIFFIVSTFMSQRNFMPLLRLAGSALVLFTPFWTLTALDHITEAFDKTSAQWRVWRSIHISFLSSLGALLVGSIVFLSNRGRYWARRHLPWAHWACVPVGTVLGFLVMLAIVGGYGWEEFDYMLALPSLSVKAIKFCARKAPRAIYRYWQTKEPIEGSLLSWWANDRLEEIMRRDEL